jgi:hypothetical protein
VRGKRVGGRVRQRACGVGLDEIKFNKRSFAFLARLHWGFTGAQGSAKLKSPETIIKGGGVGLSCLHRCADVDSLRSLYFRF